MSADQEPPPRPAAREGEIEFDPPLGKFPPMTFSHPVLHNASARWRSGGGSAGLVALLKDGSNLKAFQTLVRFTVAMIGVPALTMAACYFALPNLIGEQSHSQRMTAAGIAALCSVQLVIVAYLVLAFSEAQTPSTEQKKDD